MFPSPFHILITGASSGIGAALARAYARPGVFLFLGGRDPVRLGRVAAQCRDKGAQVEEKQLDVCAREDMYHWIVDADQRHPLDLVIANAGISGGTGGDAGETGKQARRIFEVNLTGVLNTIHHAVLCMMECGCGLSSSMSWLAYVSCWPGPPAYSASKGAGRL